MNFYIFVVSVLCNCFVTIEALQCIDDNNQPVDWFVLYKIPRVKHDNKLIQDGVGYVFASSKNYTQWFFSSHSINDSDSTLGNTLKPYYESLKKNNFDSSLPNLFHVFYNDQPPNEPSKGNKGHSKGVILADLEGGFWLIHSTPHFPVLSTEYQFSQSGTKEGQTFLCISLDLKNLNKVGIQLEYNEPQIFHSNTPEILKTKLDEIVKVVSGDTVKQPPWYNKIDITSKNGTEFTSFAKSRQFGKELYMDWIAPVLQLDLYVETWLNGPGKLSSNCSRPFKVYNVKSVSIGVAKASFNATRDHSKWAVSTNSSWICISDINRMEHQEFRGGGSVCLNDENLAALYWRSVELIEKCNTD